MCTWWWHVIRSIAQRASFRARGLVSGYASLVLSMFCVCVCVVCSFVEDSSIRYARQKGDEILGLGASKETYYASHYKNVHIDSWLLVWLSDRRIQLRVQKWGFAMWVEQKQSPGSGKRVDYTFINLHKVVVLVYGVLQSVFCKTNQYAWVLLCLRLIQPLLILSIIPISKNKCALSLVWFGQ